MLNYYLTAKLKAVAIGSDSMSETIYGKYSALRMWSYQLKLVSFVLDVERPIIISGG